MADQPRDDRGYRERLWVPWWWWPFAAVVVALLGAEVHIGLPLAWKVGTYLVLGGVVVSWLLSVSLMPVAVAGGVLRAGAARLPVEHTGEIRPLDEALRRRLAGPRADPQAYLVTRSWVRGAVYVEVTDPADPTPYWVVATRRPDRLASALRAARDRGESQPGPPGPPGPAGPPSPRSSPGPPGPPDPPNNS